jgi:aldose 1-epimerase
MHRRVLLNADTTIRLDCGDYEAHIAPAAGARLTCLRWHGGGAPLDCVVPWRAVGDFDADHWPKAGAFPMLPYSNRLQGACFEWAGQQVQLAHAPQQPHGLHGFGHRVGWRVVSAQPHALELQMDHPAPDDEWPWKFVACIRYAVSAAGFHVEISVKNVDDSAMPAALGWHPFIPMPSRAAGIAQAPTVMARRLHDVGLDGLGRTPLASADPLLRSFAVPSHRPHTSAYMLWNGVCSMPLDAQHQAILRSANSAHLLVHVPPRLDYWCAEPLTALPGALLSYTPAQRAAHLALPPGATRRMDCTLGIEPLATLPTQ